MWVVQRIILLLLWLRRGREIFKFDGYYNVLILRVFYFCWVGRWLGNNSFMLVSVCWRVVLFVLVGIKIQIIIIIIKETDQIRPRSNLLGSLNSSNGTRVRRFPPTENKFYVKFKAFFFFFSHVAGTSGNF